MKAFYIPAALLAAILLLSLLSGSYVQRCTQDWLTMLAESIEYLQEGDLDNVSARLTDTHESWDLHRLALHILLDHQGLDETEVLFSEVIAACHSNSQDELSILLAQLYAELSILSESQKLSLENIL